MTARAIKKNNRSRRKREKDAQQFKKDYQQALTHDAVRRVMGELEKVILRFLFWRRVAIGVVILGAAEALALINILVIK